MHVRVVPYDPAWEKGYEEEAQRLRQALDGLLIEIHHIGSTAVPGLMAKPVIDILPVVRDIAAVDGRNPQMEALGYACMGEFGIPGRRYFRKGGEDRTHQVHVFAAGSRGDIERHLAVRDYLRAHPAAAEAYGWLKQELAARFPEDIEGYCDGKDAFVRRLEAEAIRWARDNPGPGRGIRE